MGHSGVLAIISLQTTRARLGAGYHKHTEHCRGQLGAAVGTDSDTHVHACSLSCCWQSQLCLYGECITAVSWVREKDLLGTTPVQNRVLTKLPGTSGTKYTTSQARGKPPTHKKVLILTLVLLLFNSRMQLRIHRWETEPSQCKPADTAHGCVGVDALHEVCCCSVWEKGEKPKAHA